MAHQTWTVILVLQHAVILFRKVVAARPFSQIDFWQIFQSITDDAAINFISLGLDDLTLPISFVVAEVGFVCFVSLHFTVAMVTFVVVVVICHWCSSCCFLFCCSQSWICLFCFFDLLLLLWLILSLLLIFPLL